jgi:hypothetical protein
MGCVMKEIVKVILKRSHHNEEIEFSRDTNGTFAISVDAYSGDQAYVYGISKDEMEQIREALSKVLRG